MPLDNTRLVVVTQQVFHAPGSIRNVPCCRCIEDCHSCGVIVSTVNTIAHEVESTEAVFLELNESLMLGYKKNFERVARISVSIGKRLVDGVFDPLTEVGRGSITRLDVCRTTRCYSKQELLFLDWCCIQGAVIIGSHDRDTRVRYPGNMRVHNGAFRPTR